MITRLSLSGIPPYNDDGIALEDLRRVNFVFGGNGSGKSTMSRQLATYRAATEDPLSLTWQGAAPCAIEVYNDDFKRKAFYEDASVPGVFTLGTEDAAKRSRLDAIDQELVALRKTLQNRHGRLGTDERPGLRDDKQREWTKFRETAWEWNRAAQDPFKPLFRGANQKDSFATHLVEAHRSIASDSSYPERHELVQRAEAVFSSSTEKRPLLPIPALEHLQQANDCDLMERAIVTAADVQFADLVTGLGCSDWVKLGLSFQRQKPQTCVFCQQPAPDDLLQQLDALFDAAYQRDVDKIHQTKERYAEVVRRIRQTIQLVQDAPAEDTPSLDREALAAAIDHLNAVLDANQHAYESKTREPSRRITLNDETSACSVVRDMLVAANMRIEEHNSLVTNRTQARSALEADLWRFLSRAHHEVIDPYRRGVAEIQKGIEAIQQQIDDLTKTMGVLESERRSLLASMGDTRSTAESINATLASAGFRSFLVEPADQGRQYRVVRRDGSDRDVPKSLSEGERTLLSFLYFYQLVRDGSTDASAVRADRVVVIDDPIASVDSDVMFLVAYLVRDLAHRAAAHVAPREGADEPGCVQQLFVLTHNAHFHHAVTYKPGRRAAPERSNSFWTLTKADGQTTRAERHQSNPVRTTYEMLWQEVRDGVNAEIPPVSLQNAMRRIVEFYFVVLGTCNDIHDVANSVPEEVRPAALALTRWMHDGSHSVFGDAHAPVSQEQVRRYGDALKALFDANGSGAHWRSMMEAP